MTACHIFSFLSGQRRVIDDKLHGDRGLGDLLERNGLGILGRAQRITDMDVGDAGDRNDGTEACFLNLHFVQSVKFI